MKRRIRSAVCCLLVLCLFAAMSVPVQAATTLPDSIYLAQTGYSTCTLCATAMMIRARMYLSGSSQWSSVTESGIRSTAWINGMGLRWKFTYELNGDSVTVSHTEVSGMSAATLKAILDAHPEGIVLFCGNLPHAVFATDYEGDTFYCAEPATEYSGKRITLADSWLGYKYGSQETILNQVTAYWYVSSYSVSGSGSSTPECDCSADYAGEYRCTASDSLNIRSGHGTGYSVIGSIPGNATVTVTRASGTGSSDWAHIVYGGISGYVSMGYLEKQKTELAITGQPESVTVDENTNAVFSVSANGDGLCYQWQKRVIELDAYGAVVSESWQDLSEGGQTNTLEIFGTMENNGSKYRCVITDEYGDTVTSESAQLTVKGCGCLADYAGEYRCTASDSLNIRSGHGTGYSVIGSVPANAIVTVTKASGTGSSDWAHIVYDGISGYVSMGYLEKQAAEPGETVSFTDVADPDSFYYEPVAWAVANGITTGTTSTTFSPNDTCQRAQIVTFLWRAAGQPEPETAVNPFVDVKETDFFYKAVLWAVEKGITNGMDETHFDPTGECTRGQAVTFLWRAAGKPKASVAGSFTDVDSGAYYYDAVNWAVENEITNGMGDNMFQPNTICNRAQIVTFLYRAYHD